MKRWMHVIVAIALLGPLTIEADPLVSWFWDDPVLFENETNIPGGDLIARTLHCGNNPADQTIPDGSEAFGNVGACADRYETSTVFIMQAAPSEEDMAFIVGGVPGTYYCASSVASQQYGSRSGCSNEENFTVTEAELGFVPKPPILTILP